MNLVTGASGDVGRWLLKTGDARGVRFDLDGDYRRIIHCAWAGVPAIDRKMVEECLRYCDRTGAALTLISSGAARLLDTEYAESKRELEELCEGHTIARLYSFTGLTRFAAYEMATAPVVTVRDDSVRSYLWIGDAADYLWRLTEPGIFEVGSFLPVTMRELGSEIARQRDVPIMVQHGEGTIYLPERGLNPRPLAQQVAMMLGGLDEAGVWAARRKRPVAPDR